MDSDRDGPRKPISATKKRLQGEFDGGPGHAWITNGREIENYLVPEQVKSAVSAVHPAATARLSTGKYDSVLLMTGSRGKQISASKVAVARHISERFIPDLDVLDLRKRINAVLQFIRESNPKLVASGNAT